MAKNPYYSGPVSDHFDGTRFFNPGSSPDDRRGIRELLRWRFGPKPAKWPDHVAVTPAKPEPRIAECRVTMAGHASVLLQLEGLNILTDPVWSERASPLSFAGPKRVAAPGIRFADLPPIDLVLLSHNHYDHCDVATLRRLHDRDRPKIVTALGNDRLLFRAIPGIDVTARDWGEAVELGDGQAVALVPANHWSRRRLRDTRMALWCGFIVKSPRMQVYFAGDTGYGDGRVFRAIREEHGAPDLALLPIGAYEPRWFMAPQHVDPDEAVAIFRDLGATHGLGIHWGTFQLTNEPREEPAERLQEALRQQNIAPSAFAPLRPGESADVTL